MRLLDAHCSAKSAIVAATVVACLVTTAGQLTAAPRPSGTVPQGMSGPTRIETALDGEATASVVALANRTRDALGFPAGVRQVATHVSDGFEGIEYNEVAETDASGAIISLAQFDMTGNVLTAARLDRPPSVGGDVGASVAVATAQQTVLRVGFDLGAPSSTVRDDATSGWTLHWARREAGVPVRGDETRLQLFRDGTVQSMARIRHQLAPAPDQRMDAAAAVQVATDSVGRWSADSATGYALQATSLQWVEPNGAFDPAQISTTPVPYRLAWVTDVQPQGAAADYVWLIQLFVDAGDGTVIGGDFVE